MDSSSSHPDRPSRPSSPSSQQGQSPHPGSPQGGNRENISDCEKQKPKAPSADLLAAIYRNVPVLVVHLSADGVVLHCNPEVTRVTGYAEGELMGKNFWAVLFPGRLFAQVPKFVSAIHPLQALGKDVAMVLRTKEGRERTVAWTRFLHDAAREGVEESIVCVGNDLTDRLVELDRAEGVGADDAEVFVPFDAVEAAAIEGDIVTPLAISPPVPQAGDGTSNAIQQVHEFLTEMDKRVAALETAFTEGELEQLASIAAGLRNGAHACGLLDFSSRVERLRMAACTGAFPTVGDLVQEIVGLCKGKG